MCELSVQYQYSITQQGIAICVCTRMGYDTRAHGYILKIHQFYIHDIKSLLGRATRFETTRTLSFPRRPPIATGMPRRQFYFTEKNERNSSESVVRSLKLKAGTGRQTDRQTDKNRRRARDDDRSKVRGKRKEEEKKCPQKSEAKKAVKSLTLQMMRAAPKKTEFLGQQQKRGLLFYFRGKNTRLLHGCVKMPAASFSMSGPTDRQTDPVICCPCPWCLQQEINNHCKMSIPTYLWILSRILSIFSLVQALALELKGIVKDYRCRILDGSAIFILPSRVCCDLFQVTESVIWVAKDLG